MNIADTLVAPDLLTRDGHADRIGPDAEPEHPRGGPMSDSSAEGLDALERGLDLAAQALRQAADPEQRAARLAVVVRSLWPDSVHAGCRLTQAGQSHVGVLGRDGEIVRKAPASGGAEVFPPALTTPGCHWVTADMAGARDHGTLAVALPAGGGDEPRRVLGLLARHLALQLDLEAQRREQDGLRTAVAEQAWSANLGALASPVTHEFNNFLNVVLLQVALLERDSSEKRRGEFQVIRQQGKAIAELVRQWQQYRYRQQPAAQPVEVNGVVREAVEALSREEPAFGEARIRLAPSAGKGKPGGSEVWVCLDLAADLPPVLGTYLDLLRLVRFLVANAVAATAVPPGTILIRTEMSEGQVVLRVEDSGPAIDADLLPQVFEPLVAAREGPNRLEMATCKTLAQRRLQGNIHAENRPEGGVAIVVSLKPWG